MANRLPIEELMKITNCKFHDFIFKLALTRTQFKITTKAVNIFTSKTVSRAELEALTRRFAELGPDKTDRVDRARFRDLLADTFGVDDSLLMDRGMGNICVFRFH